MDGSKSERTCSDCCEHAAERIDELRQSLIGGIEGVKSGHDLAKWAAANEKLLARAQRR